MIVSPWKTAWRLIEIILCDVGMLDGEMRGHDVVMLLGLLAEGGSILC